MKPLRERLEGLIEEAIALLDQIDGDSDLELEPPECDLGGLCVRIGSQLMDDLEHDATDSEPWLGWLERTNQGLPHHGLMADLDYEGGSGEWEVTYAA